MHKSRSKRVQRSVKTVPREPTSKTKGPGRPEHIPTEHLRGIIRRLSASGCPPERTAKYVGLAHRTLRKYYESEVDLATDGVAELAMGALINAIKKGQGWAVCFFFKCRFGWSEKFNVASTQTLNVKGLTDEELADFNRYLEKISHNGNSVEGEEAGGGGITSEPRTVQVPSRIH